MTALRFNCALTGLMLVSGSSLTLAADDPYAEVIVTGTRAQGRSEAGATVPVAVYDARDLAASGFTDLGRALEAIASSINMPHAQTTPSAASTRSITLKGMAPDQVLVLINGKRWHASSVLVFNNAVGRGSAPYDLGAIALSAVERIEVLGDGAAAQYGSDAIAGVVNVILKSDSSGGRYSMQTGITDRGDGFAYDLTGSQGIALGGPGDHLTLSADVRHQEATNRAIPDPRNGGRIDQQLGDPRALDAAIAADTAYRVGAADLYGSLLLSRRDSQSPGQFRLPGTSVLYPQGFLPQINPVLWDVTAIAGTRAELGGGVRMDLSDSYGYNSARFQVRDTANAALGAASPTQFYAGTTRYDQNTLSLVFTRALTAQGLSANLAAGAEYRMEGYQITPGDPLSYQQGGAQGFPGLSPRIPVDDSRSAGSAFVDLEGGVHGLTLGVAGRFDHYSDFGDALTWKTTARADLASWIALRGSLGTGFRAPSLQQQHFSSVVSQINASGTLVRTGTYQVLDPIAAALGALPLRAETSRDQSAGLILHPLDALLLSADWYRIDVDHRIVLSDQLSGRDVTAVLAANGVTDVQQVQFFTNAASTSTDGWELSASYQASLGTGALQTHVQYGRYHTQLRFLAPDTVLPAHTLLGPTSLGLLISAQPSSKLTSSFTYTRGVLGMTLNVDHYGSWTSAPVGVPQTFEGRTLVDLTTQLQLSRSVALRAGVLNVGDTYPDTLQGGAALGLSYGDEAPFGINGRSYFLSVQLAD